MITKAGTFRFTGPAGSGITIKFYVTITFYDTDKPFKLMSTNIFTVLLPELHLFNDEFAVRGRFICTYLRIRGP